ncbi:conserved protein of unknown function [[Clostridium] ultunense Esp]|uniref:Uncharacterized protein n=2 Tax=Schnuerera ultunensis TaxID=45497 RepID=A0A1M4PL29_9FIRM|nr:conserved protein of unknown function [[Clostridium] ultunense Esp]
MPTVGTIVITPEGKGTIIDTYTLLEMVKVKVRLDDDTEELFNHKIDEIIITNERDPQYAQEVEDVEEDFDNLE